MESSLNEAVAQLPSLREKAKFQKSDLYVILHGLTGFFGSVMGKSPFSAVDTVLTVKGHFSSKCRLAPIKEHNNNIKRWMDFGKAYAALKNSTELDFDKSDIEAVPEVMKVKRALNMHGG